MPKKKPSEEANMLRSRRKPSGTPSPLESSDLDHSPLVPIRSCIPSYHDDLEGFQVEDKTLLEMRTSEESDSHLSYPSHEPSLMEELRSALVEGKPGFDKILNSKKSKRDMTFNFSLSSSNSSLNLTLPPERRRNKVLTRKKKNDITVDFTMNDTASSFDDQENKSPVLQSNRPKPLFKRPFDKEMSMNIRFDDVSDSDSSKVLTHDDDDDSLSTLDPKTRAVPLKSSLRSKIAPNKNITMDISLDQSDDKEKSTGQSSLNDRQGSSNPLCEASHLDDSPKIDSNADHRTLKLFEKKTKRDRNMTFDLSLGSSKGSETALDISNVKAPASASDENEIHDSPSVCRISPCVEKMPIDDAAQVNKTAHDAEVNDTESESHGQSLPSTSMTNNATKFENFETIPNQINNQTFTLDDAKEVVHDLSAVLLPNPSDIAPGCREEPQINDNTYLVERETSEDPSTQQETRVEVDAAIEDSPAPRVPIPSPTRGTAVSQKRLRLISGGSSNNDAPLDSKNTSLDSELQIGRVVDEDQLNMKRDCNLKGKRHRFSVNFTLSDTTTIDDSITSPKIVENRTEPLSRKNTNKISVPLQLDDVMAQRLDVGGNERDDDGDASRLSVPKTCGMNGANDISMSPVISREHANPLKPRLGKCKVSIPFRSDETCIDDGSPKVVAEGQKQVSDSNILNPENPDDERGLSDLKGSESSTLKPTGVENDGDSTSYLLPSGKTINPLMKRRLERNKISIQCRLEDTVVDSISTSGGALRFCNVEEERLNLRKISVQPQETSCVSGGISPSMEGNSGVASLPDLSQPSDELHLALSSCESLQLSGVDSSCKPVEGGSSYMDEKRKNSVVEIRHAVTAHDVNQPPYSQANQPPDSQVFSEKKPLLRRSKRRTKNSTVSVNSSNSMDNDSNPSGLVGKLIANPTQNIISVASSSSSCDLEEASSSGPTYEQKSSTPKTKDSDSDVERVSIRAAHSAEDLQAHGIQDVSNPCAESKATDVFSSLEVAKEFGRRDSSKSSAQNSISQSSRQTRNSLLSLDLSRSKRSNDTVSGVQPSIKNQVVVGETLSEDLSQLEVAAMQDAENPSKTKEMGASTLLETSNGKCQTDCNPTANASAIGDAENGIQLHTDEREIVSHLLRSSPAFANRTTDNGVTQMEIPKNTGITIDEACKRDGNVTDTKIDQLRSSIDPPLHPPTLLHANCLTAVDEVPGPSVVSPTMAIPDEPVLIHENVLPYSPRGNGINQALDEETVTNMPTATHTMQTSTSSLHLQLTAMNTEVGVATSDKSHCTVPDLTPTVETVPLPSEQLSLHDPPVAKGGALKVSSENAENPPQDVMKTVSVGKPASDSLCESHHEAISQDAKHPNEQEVASVDKLISFVKLASEVGQGLPDEQENEHLLAPSTLIPGTGPSKTAMQDCQPKPEVLRQSKRKSVSFKPSTENLYHSPPDHAFELPDQIADGKTHLENGYEFSRIQMTTDISEIQSSPSNKRAKRHYSSTPISKSKRGIISSKPDENEFIRPQPLANAPHATHQLFVPPAPHVTKRVSIQPVPEIITTLRPDPQVKTDMTNEGNQGNSDSGSATSSYDLSCENSLEISAIPKDVTAPKWGNVYHSTPLHRTKASMKKARKKAEEPPPVPQTQEERPSEALLVNHSVQTSRDLRSRSKTSIESGSSVEQISQNASGLLRRSARRNQTPAPVVPHTPKSSDDEPVDGSPADRISIQDNTIVSTRIESQSKNRGSRTRSTTGSTLKSYDSHRKMTSRRLFNNMDEDKSSTDPGYPSEEMETSPPISTDVPPTSNDVGSTLHQDVDMIMSPAETSIAQSYQPSIPRTDENSISFQRPDDYSDSESVVSGVSTGSSGSVPPHIVTRQSFESQLSTLRHQSRRHSREKGKSAHQAEPPKTRSKNAIQRPDPAAALNLIFPVEVPVKKRKRTPPAAVKLFNPGAKWKKSKQLYAWLKKKLEPQFKLRTNLEAERLVIELEHARVLVSHGYKKDALDSCVRCLQNLNICSNQLQLWGFFMKFMPFDFVREVVPMGGAFGKPFNPDHSFMPEDCL